MSWIAKLVAFVAPKPNFSTRRRAARLASQQAASEEALAEQRLAAAEKERAAAEESKAKTISTYADAAQKMLRNVAIVYGFLATFQYFFLSLHSYPSGLTVGDSLLFLFIAIGYGFVSVMLAFSGLIFFVPDFAARPLGRKAEPIPASSNPQPLLGAGGAGGLLLGFVAIAAPLTYQLDRLRPLLVESFYWIGLAWAVLFAIGSFLACGRKWKSLPMAFTHWLLVDLLFPLFVLSNGAAAAIFVVSMALAGTALWLSLRTVDDLVKPAPSPSTGKTGEASDADEKNRQRSLRTRRLAAGGFAVMAFFFPLVLDYPLLDGRISAKVLNSLGLRIENATVRMTGSALANTRSQQAISDAALSFCDEADGSALVSPITLLWNGPGAHALIALGPAAAQFDKEKRDLVPRFEVAASDIQVVRPGARRCRDAPHGVLFPTNSAKATFPTDTSLLLQDVEHAARDIYPTAASTPAGAPPREHWRLARVLVTGYADDMAPPQNGNELLARRRAACIAADVVQRLQDTGLAPDAASIVDWEGQDSRALAKSCGPHPDRPQQAECNAPNRHTRVRMIFECRDGKDHPSTRCALGSDTENLPVSATASAIPTANPTASAPANSAAESACAGEDHSASPPTR